MIELACWSKFACVGSHVIRAGFLLLKGDVISSKVRDPNLKKKIQKTVEGWVNKTDPATLEGPSTWRIGKPKEFKGTCSTLRLSRG